MKKTMFALLLSMALLWCGAVALADFVFPRGITEIADEAFMNAQLAYHLTIPEGVKAIGHRAFLGSRALQVKLPASLTYIAPDAFGPFASFEVLPGSYAKQWCIDNGYFYDEMRVSVNVESIVTYADKPAVLKALCSYPGRVDFYRWETSTDLMNWNVVQGQKGETFQVNYIENVEESYVRCRASVNGVLLEYANYATVAHKPGIMKFDTDRSRALSGDALYLEWTNMGTGMEYYLHLWKPDASLGNGGSWEEIASKLGSSSYTVFGLEKETEYHFAVVALPEKDDGRELRYEADTFSLTTLNEPYSFRITDSRVVGTSFYCEWERVDGACYILEYIREGRDPYVISDCWTSNALWIYGLPMDVDFTIKVTAWRPDSQQADSGYTIASASVDGRSGNYDPSITLNDITVTDGIAQLSWNELCGATYAVFMSTDGGETMVPIASGISNPYYEVNGLERGKRYEFSVIAACGNWDTSSESKSVLIPGKKAGSAEYRALLIGEASFRGDMRAERNYGDVEMIAKALSTVNAPNGSHYSVVRRKDLTADQIRDEIWSTFSDADEDDVSLLFIATHGDINEMGEDAGSLAAVDSSGNEDSLDLYVLANDLTRIKGKVIVWLGSCGSGAIIYEHGVPQNGDEALATAAMEVFAACDSEDPVPADAADELVSDAMEKYGAGELRQEGKFYVLTAARYHQMSWGVEEQRMNYFGKFLSEGITNTNGQITADANDDGKLTQNELFLYIKSREEDEADFIYQNVQTYPQDSDYVLFVR